VHQSIQNAVGHRGITDISSMASLSNLVTVSLTNNPITNISAMAGWSKAENIVMEYTDLSGTVPSLPGLGNSGAALNFDLANTGINNISNLITSIPPGFQTSGSVFKITNDASIPISQIHALQTAVPTLTITGP